MKKPGFKSMIAFAIMMVAGFCNVVLGQDFNGTWEGTMEAGVYSLQLVFQRRHRHVGFTRSGWIQLAGNSHHHRQ